MSCGCNQCGVGRLDLCAYTNGAIRPQFYINGANMQPFDMTGWTARMEVRESDDPNLSPLLTIQTNVPTANGSIINMAFPDVGGVEVFIDHRDIEFMGAGDYVYDIVFADTLNIQRPLVRGRFRVLQGITS